MQRTETALSGRAVCKAGKCKEAGVKIEKDELRLGTWIEFKNGGASWQWRHWYGWPIYISSPSIPVHRTYKVLANNIRGCVTGFQLQNLRKNLEDPENPGGYRWEFLDGYEGDERNSLDKFPELQEKVKRVIIQGFIDPEDFNGVTMPQSRD